MEADVGVTARDTGTAGAMVSSAPALAPPELALIVVVPLESEVARPVALTTAIPGSDEVQVAEVVRS